MSLIPAFGRQRLLNLCEFKASPVYRVSSRTARSTQRNHVSKTNKQTKTKRIALVMVSLHSNRNPIQDTFECSPVLLYSVLVFLFVCLVGWLVLFFVCLFVCFVFFKTGFLCVTLERVLELTLQTRLILNSQRLACLCFLSAGIEGMGHHCPAALQFLKYIDCRHPHKQYKPHSLWYRHSANNGSELWIHILLIIDFFLVLFLYLLYQI